MHSCHSVVGEALIVSGKEERRARHLQEHGA
jgi:hypothetical protein